MVIVVDIDSVIEAFYHTLHEYGPEFQKDILFKDVDFYLLFEVKVKLAHKSNTENIRCGFFYSVTPSLIFNDDRGYYIN